MKETIVMICAGGPAPGMNTVLASVAKTFLQKGYRVLGLHGGYTGFFSDTQRVVDFDFELADTIFNKGGSYLQMSRFKPKQKNYDEQFNKDFFIDNNIKLLVTVGGDDTSTTAISMVAHLKKCNLDIANIHVPKTIDNDLPLPEGCPTFGYQSAKSKGAEIARTVYVDSKTSGNWFVICAMGRSAGHLAFGIGTAAHYPMIIIPEMFDKATITVDKIVNLVISSIIKRDIMGQPFGVAMISEGVFHELSAEEIEKTGIVFSYDDHGHPELGKVSKAQVFSQMISNKIAQLGLKAKMRPVELGYEVRCCDPIGYDVSYCSVMGMGVYKLFKEGKSGGIVFQTPEGEISFVDFNDVLNVETGKIPPRLVNIHSDKFQLVMDNILNYLTEDDYKAASKYVENPEDFDFKKILNW